MSCCNFNGQEGGGNNPKAEMVTEEMLEWVRASGRPYEMENCCTNPDICGADQSCVGCQCMGQRNELTTGNMQGLPGMTGRTGGPRKPMGGPGTFKTGGPRIPGRPDFGFDGGAVKKNWLPLVVLGVSLMIGIGITEWATKKI